MVDKLGDAGSGRAAVEVQAVNFNNAVDAWHKPPTKRRESLQLRYSRISERWGAPWRIASAK